MLGLKLNHVSKRGPWKEWTRGLFYQESPETTLIHKDYLTQLLIRWQNSRQLIGGHIKKKNPREQYGF